MFRGPLSSPWAPSHASPGLLLFFPSFKTWILQPGHSQKVKGLNNLLPCWGREERVSGPSFSFLTPSAPPDFLHPGTDYPVCVWRDNPWQILHSKVLDFIRKSCNSLTTVHQALQHATTWPTESLWTCHLTLVFIFKNSLIFIKASYSLLRSMMAFPDPTIFIGNNIISLLWSLGWMSIHTHQSAVLKWCLLCNIWWKLKRPAMVTEVRWPVVPPQGRRLLLHCVQSYSPWSSRDFQLRAVCSANWLNVTFHASPKPANGTSHDDAGKQPALQHAVIWLELNELK